ncbi:hypothetical protein BBJ28_00008233 [Nothophytophthora sp. Chile5]|nr:hypothetical protein BBJ28_00008233 [Nothophytophthora sp. Chile5]
MQRRRSKEDTLVPSSAYDQLRVKAFPPVRLGSWHRYRSVSQEFAEMVLKPEASSIAREPTVRRFAGLFTEVLSTSANFGRLRIKLEQILTPTSTRGRKTKIICAIGPASWSVEMLEITTDYGVEGDSSRIACTYELLPSSVAVGSKILCDDGSLVMTVLECQPDSIIVQVHNDHVLEEKKNMNLPGSLAMCYIPGITEKDEDDLLNFAIPQAVDIVSGSFVRSAANVRAIRECLGHAGRYIRVHAKIESQEALRNIDEIIAEADGIHVSRGDLGMELSPERVFLAQKMIIAKANRAGKPVVTSTQMLQSMTKKPTPSNAECTDVANAVLDGTDAMMLSAETAKGLYPKEAVQTMAKICVEAEAALDYAELYRVSQALNLQHISMCESVASSAVEIAIDVCAKLIISFTETGSSTKLLAKYRPEANILAVTASGSTARQLSGVSRYW